VRRIVGCVVLLSALMLPDATSASPMSSNLALSNLGASSQAYCADAEEIELLNEINDYRAANGLAPLTLSATLGAAADHHSESMASFNYFDPSHDLHFEGAAQDETVIWQENIANFGYPDNTHTSRAENLAAGYERAAETLAQWQSSPSHDEHLLSTKFQAIGVGRAFNPESEYRWYWTVTFGSLVDSKASACVESAGAEGSPAPGSELSIMRSGRNGSSTDSSAVYDGDEATTWYTTKARTPSNGYVWIDFGGLRTVSRIEYLFSSGGSADAFEIQVSTDKMEWTTIASLGEPEAGDWTTLEWSGQARYVRFYFTNPNGDPVLGNLAEVRVFA
jgi:uncharacterized protein YkwD